MLLISADFLTSGFILGTEVPLLLERRKAEGLVVIPLVARSCPWKGIPWLSEIQCRPKDGIPLARERDRAHEVEETLTALVLEIRDLLAVTSRIPASAFLPHLDIGRLPISGPLFVAREPELARLGAAWEDPGVHVLTFVAFGGVGKSTLVGRWIASVSNIGWKDARRVLDCSFYSQGTVIRAYASWLGEGRELAVLRLLGLFDRPAAKEALAALRARPEIPGLTEPLVALSEEEWQWAVSSLREHGFPHHAQMNTVPGR